MRILVTGAAGFIGSHLVESLVAEGNDVVSFVKPGKDISFIANTRTDIIYTDLNDFGSLKKATEGIEAVYHLAAIPKWEGWVSRQKYKMVNVEGTNQEYLTHDQPSEFLISLENRAETPTTIIFSGSIPSMSHSNTSPAAAGWLRTARARKPTAQIPHTEKLPLMVSTFLW